MDARRRDEVATEAQRLLVTAERLSLRQGGVHIDDPAMRGISLAQLERINRIASVQCARDQWVSSASGEPLSADTLNVHDLLEHLIAPATSGRGCSLVELIADEPAAQEPRHYCCHWFGMPFSHLLRCLRTHVADHKLDPRATVYWVAWAALSTQDAARAREPEGDVELEQLPFCRALHHSSTLLAALDVGGTFFSRLWPLLELHLALSTHPRGGNYRVDVYAAAPGRWDAKAVGLVDGVARSDNAVVAKLLREEFFPRALVEAARACSVLRAEASELTELLRLRARAGEGDQAQQIDKAVRARVAAPMLPVLLEQSARAGANRLAVGTELAITLDGLKEARLPSLTLLCKNVPRAALAAKLAHSLPSADALEVLNLKALGPPIMAGVVRLLLDDGCRLRELDLRANELDAACGNELAEALRTNRTLRSLRVGDNKLATGGHAICEALRTNFSLRYLAIDRNGLTSEAGEMLGRSLRQGNQTLQELDISHNELGERGGTNVAMGLIINSSLIKLDIGSNQLGHKVEEDLRSAWQWQVVGKAPPNGAKPVRPVGLHI